jgi:hypothetical protein
MVALASVISKWFAAHWSLVLVGWQVLQESKWALPVLILGFAAYRLHVAVRAWRQEVAAVSRDSDNLRRRLQIYAESGSSAHETEDAPALIDLWMTRPWKKMSKPQLALLYREAQRDSPPYLQLKIRALFREKYHSYPPHWTLVALDSLAARMAFVNLFSARVSSLLVQPKGSGPDPCSYVEEFLPQADGSPAKWAEVLEKDLKRYGIAWFESLVEYVEQRDDVGPWPPEITGAQSERMEMILWILYEEYVGSRPLLSEREAVRRLHLRLPPSLLDVPITKRGFRDETGSRWIDGIETSVDRRVLSLDYEPLPDIVPLEALAENHPGWQIEFQWNHLALIAQVGFSREQARGGVNRPNFRIAA